MQEVVMTPSISSADLADCQAVVNTFEESVVALRKRTTVIQSAVTTMEES
jgi:hypothetical protein